MPILPFSGLYMELFYAGGQVENDKFSIMLDECAYLGNLPLAGSRLRQFGTHQLRQYAQRKHPRRLLRLDAETPAYPITTSVDAATWRAVSEGIGTEIP